MNSGSLWYRAVRWFVRSVVLNILGPVRVMNEENEPLVGPVIVAPIHLSYLDPPLVACCMRRAITFMAKEELFKPGLGALIRSLGAFPVQRGAGDTEAIRIALKLLEEGRAVLLFPEGTRGDGVKMGKLTAGVAMLARRTGARVFPIGIRGCEKVWPRHQKWPRRSPITVVFGAPMTYAEVVADPKDKEGRERFNAELERRLLALNEEAGLPLKTASKT
ncbi:MAG: 1-acyl-sn-glycerol-3-phosphate acyltransferase [Chthonomonas sp.]|nr:1-acyl-sn-glycerol-3-phosphate acyltransferase [Chthonomonas sp.]